jgi:hypothetical protein
MRTFTTESADASSVVPTGGQSGLGARLLPELPDWISGEAIIGLALVGFVAFAVTGFLGYAWDQSWLAILPQSIRALLFDKPTALFAYACLLTVTLQTYMMRHPSPRQEMAADPDRIMPQPGRLWRTLIVTLAAILIVVLTDRNPDWLQTFLTQVATIFKVTDPGRLIANVVNLWFIFVVASDSGVRWTAAGRALLASRRDRPLRERRLAGLFGLIANDLLAGSVLLGLLSLAFRADVLSFFAFIFQARVGQALRLITGPRPSSLPVADCTVSVRFKSCGGAPIDPSKLPTITYVDWNAMLLVLILGLVALGCYLLLRLLNLRRPLWEVLRDAARELRNVNRLLGLVVEALVAPLRRAAWPALIVVGVFFAATATHFIQYYLWILSCQHQLWLYHSIAGPISPFGGCAAMPFDLAWQNYAFLGLALAMTALAAGAIVSSAMIQLYDRNNPERSERQVLGYWLPALVRVGGLALVPIGVLSLALCVLDFFLVQIVGQLSPSTHVPMSYFPPGAITYVAALAAVCVLVAGYARRRRRGDRL